MKIQVETTISLSAKATFDESGNVAVKVSGTMPYGNRQASAFSEGASSETIELFHVAFEALLSEKQEQVVLATQAAQSEALTVAVRMGEL